MSTWEPLLDGELLERAQNAQAELTEALSAGPALIIRKDWDAEAARKSPAFLASGLPGQALYFGYLRQAGGGERCAELGLPLLNRAIALASAENLAPALFGGFVGTAWAVIHLAGRLYPGEQEDPYLEIDEVLLTSLQREPCPYHFDLISGLVGVGVYALARLPRPSARRLLEAIVDRLGELSEEEAAGTTWLTPPDFLDDTQREQNPQGSHCVGLAHGTPGVVALLAGIWQADVARAEVGPLLESSVAWVLAQAQPADSPWRFPSWVGARGEPSPARLAWCYGDPGVAAALLWAAQATGRDDWRAEALQTARVAARRPLESAFVNDGCFCHGMAGLAHIFNRLYQGSGDDALAQAALFWYEKLLADRRPGQGCGGFSFTYKYVDGVERVADPGLLYGASGVGLALLAATTPVEPQWDSAFLTDVPRHRA